MNLSWGGGGGPGLGVWEGGGERVQVGRGKRVGGEGRGCGWGGGEREWVGWG